MKNRDASRGSDALCYLLYAAFTAFLLHSSWLRWPDPWVDFGYFLYNAWRVSEGALPGADLSYYYGPLALLFYGGLFRAFGTGILLVYKVNFFLLCADVVLIHRFFRAFSRSAAFLATSCFLGVFALGQYVMNGNYNFLAPYKPEIALGMPLLLLQALASRRFTPRRGALAGFLFGCLLLTSTELAFASAAVMAVLLLSLRPSPRELIAVSVPAVAAPLACFCYFQWRSGSWHGALVATFRALEVLSHKSLLSDPALRSAMGAGDPVAHAQTALLVAGAFALVAILYVALMGALRGRGARALGGLLLGAALPLGALTAWGHSYLWSFFPRCLPLLPLIGLVLWARRREERVELGLWSALSLALLLRILGEPLFRHYGFSLAMASTLLVFPLLVDVLPGLLLRRRIDADGLLPLAWGLAAALVLTALTLRQPFFDRKSFPVTSGQDALLDWDPALSSRGPGMRELLARLSAKARAGDLVLGLPDGHIVNYLLRTRRPAPYSLSLGELHEFGEAEILASYRRARPRFVFVSGDGGFGERYGRSILDWVRAEYRMDWIFGDPPWLALYEAR